MNNRYDEKARKNKLGQVLLAFLLLMPLAVWVLYVCVDGLVKGFNSTDLIGVVLSIVVITAYVTMLVRGVLQYRSPYEYASPLVSVDGN